MAQPADLYTLLRFYANRVHNPVFPLDGFISFLEKYARKYAPQRADLAPWTAETARKVTDGLHGLEEGGLITVASDQKGKIVAVGQYYVDLVQQSARSHEQTPELPFWDETSLHTVIPAKDLRVLTLESDFTTYLVSPQGGVLPILKLVFPEGRGTTLLLSGMIPRKLMELALLKLRHFLRSHNNRDYLQHKLMAAFQGKESTLKETMNQLVSRPLDAIKDLERPGDFSYQFWSYFASLVKSDIRKRNELIAEDIAAIQSISILEVFNNFYKGKIQKERDTETALKNLELQLEKAPYSYTMDDIVRFTDSKGVPLLGQYDKETLENWLKAQTTSGDLSTLPDILIIHGASNEKWYIKKASLLPLVMKLLGEARPKIKTSLSQRWFKMMSDYRHEDSMEEDSNFESALASLLSAMSPMLSTLLAEKTLYLVYTELETSGAGVPDTARLFEKGQLAPLSDLLMLKRKNMVTDVQMLLPFWHSVPILTGIIAFFKHLGQPSPSKKAGDKGESEDQTHKLTQNPADSTALKKNELREAARRAEAVLVPEGYTIENYLEELLGRWNRLIGEETKNNLTEDVNSLIRDYLRRTARHLRAATFTPDRIRELATSLADSPSLMKLPARDALRSYIEVYMVRLIIR